MRITAYLASSFSHEAEGRVRKETMQSNAVSHAKTFSKIFCHRVQICRFYLSCKILKFSSPENGKQS